MASVVAIKVFGTVITSSPRPMPAAIKENRRASVPLLTVMQYLLLRVLDGVFLNLEKVFPSLSFHLLEVGEALGFRFF
jgi:hypothetical protein